MISNPYFYLIAVPAVLITGISKGGFGVGLGILTVPLLTLVIGPIQAAAVILPILVLMDIVGVVAYRSDWDRANMRIMLPGALFGIAVGALTFRYVSERHLELLTGLIALGFTLQSLSGADRAAAPHGPSLATGSFWSAMSGFTSFIANAGSAPIQVYLLPQRLDKTLFVGTTVVFFAVVNFVKLGPYLWLGLLTNENLATSLVLLPLAPVGVWLGIWAHNRVSPVLFYRLCYLILVIVGGKLVWDGLFAAGGLVAS